MTARRFLPYLPCLLAGPVTGPLLALAVASGRKGQWGRAGACIAGIVAFYAGAPALLVAELHWLHSLHH